MARRKRSVGGGPGIMSKNLRGGVPRLQGTRISMPRGKIMANFVVRCNFLRR